MPTSIKKIISGGQTGADRAALDFALEHGIEIGGHVPKSRTAEDGAISDRYPNLTETASENTAERTEKNVLDSDATLIFSHGPLTGGSKLALVLTLTHKKPVLHIDLSELSPVEAVGASMPGCTRQIAEF